jgi:hypothetical protein
MPRATLAFACIVSLGLGATLCVAADPAITHVRIGWQGHFKRGHWAEVQADITAGDQPLSGELHVISRDGDGASVAYICPQRTELNAGEMETYTTLVKMGPPQSGLQLRVLGSGQTLMQQSLSSMEVSGEWKPGEKTLARGHRSTALIIATLGADSGAESAAKLLGAGLEDEVTAIALTSALELPVSVQGYDAIDCMVMTFGKADPLAAASPQQLSALSQWQQLGGHVVAVAGESAAELTRSDLPWASAIQGRFQTRSPLTSDAGLRSFAGEALELSPPPQVWQLESPAAQVMVRESGSGSSDRPLAVEYPVGWGRLSVVLLDLSEPPLVDWRGRPRFLARVISEEALANEPQAVRSGGRMTHLGYRDLAGQLRMALDQFEGVAPVHFHPVAGALLVYLILLGPGEYYLLRTAAPRAMHLTWLAFPALIIGFTAAAVAWGQSAHGVAVKVNQVEIVDLDPLGGQQRGTFWTSVFSPRADNMVLAAQPGKPLPKATVTSVQLAWHSQPGDGLGGIDVALGGVNVAPLIARSPEPYELLLGRENDPAVVRNLPMALASSKAFVGNWQGTIPVVNDASQLRRGKLLDIEGTFRSILPVPLKNAFLAHGDWMYRALNEVQPGATINVANLDRKHLEYFFTRRSLLKEKEPASPWNQEETDIARIMDIMMFHQGLQGRNYTVLSHRYHGDLDLTHLLHQGYAVLVGRAESPLVELKMSGEPVEEENVRRWTYYRILYPVAPRD